jgi:hypothetical protein
MQTHAIMMTEKEKKAAQKFVDLMLKVTFRICHWNQDGELKSRSSGFLYRKSESSPILVITAGHGTPPEGSFIETTHVHKDKTAAINAGKFNVFHQQDGIDYAYSELPLERIQKSLSPDMSFEFTCYKESFVNAVKNEAYGFAVRNNYEFVKMGVTPTYLCYELYLELERQEEHVNYFKPSRQIQKDEYYAGASGSPISDPSGKICSILIGGTEPRELLRAFRLDNIVLP